MHGQQNIKKSINTNYLQATKEASASLWNENSCSRLLDVGIKVSQPNPPAQCLSSLCPPKIFFSALETDDNPSDPEKSSYMRCSKVTTFYIT